ncbi:hypothetical protein SPF06_00980 [Sinomonas sp. JGH33]|uniref:Uncharacterized protein n=1 Tax=Sinomonas terricola TaxID=3110330 RepID=A0ABU5T1C2_9MICC|nr:hypothetical protein [Sinomonas sp. JGH33]MEA5453284.1 hypothetical protein [Sinomonas sp. JGH33]
MTAPPPTPRLIGYTAAAAHHEMESVAVLMSSIAQLELADHRHRVKRTEHRTPNSWAETLVCTCGDWIHPDESWDAHIIAAAGECE